MSSAKTTIDHDTIRQWVEQRGGCPARVKGTGAADGDPGILRVDFPGFSGADTLEQIEWETFFEAFEDNGLAFLYQDEPNSRFSKLIARDGEDRERRTSPGDALELLESQHREVEALFEQLHEAGSVRQKSELFAELADQLAAHMKIEEELFYPEVCVDDTRERLHASVDEHLASKRALASLLELEASDSRFAAKLDVLERLVQQHVELEEQELFAEVRELDDVDLDELGRRMKERYAELIAGEPRGEVPEELDEPANLPC